MSIAAALLVGILTWIAVPHRAQETPQTPAASETAEELYRRFEKRFVESKSVSVRIEGTVERSEGKVETYSGSWKAKPGGKLAYHFRSGIDESSPSSSKRRPSVAVSAPTIRRFIAPNSRGRSG